MEDHQKWLKYIFRGKWMSVAKFNCNPSSSCLDISLKTTDVNLIVVVDLCCIWSENLGFVHYLKSQGINEVNRIHPLGTTNILTETDGN